MHFIYLKNKPAIKLHFHLNRIDYKKLSEKGARVQRLLWASTSNKNPDYSDIKNIEALVVPNTVNTVSLKTLEAYRDHGKPKSRIESGLKNANRLLKSLPELGIDLDKIR